jgi:polysaccharide export outer membrane protein
VYVLGEVAKPGKYQLKSYITVLQAISMAGGFTIYASKNNLQVLRVIENGDNKRKEIRIPLRYSDLVSGQGEPGNIVLFSGDTLVVP